MIVAVNTKSMNLNTLQQVGTQKLGHSFTQAPYLGASYGINALYSTWVPRQHIKFLSPMTFSQKLYQFQALTPKAEEIVNQNYEQALNEANRLEKVNNLLSEIATLAK